MSVVRRAISITEQQDAWIKDRIASGQYANQSEYIRDLIRRDQADQVETEAIRAALAEAEESGPSEPFDAEKFKAEMKAEYGRV